MNEYLLIGTVLKPQGIHGECKIRSYAADTEMYYQWKTLYIRNNNAFLPVSVHVVRISDGYVYAVLNNSVSADDAEKYRDTELYVDRSHTAPAEEGAVLIADLLGCEARDEKGTYVGILTDVFQYGTVDTWVFNTGKGTLMAPALLSVFPEVDIEKKTILVIRERLEEVAVRS